MVFQLEIYSNNVKGNEWFENKELCVVLQSDTINKYSKTTIVVPIFEGHKPWPFVVNLRPNLINSLLFPCHINLKYMQTKNLSDFIVPYGKLEEKYLDKIEPAIKSLFF